MTMKTERLDLLVRVADSRTDTAARDLARQQALLHDQSTRLEELRGYQREYRARPMPPSPALIANRERFLARLGEAEDQQVKAVTAAQAGVQAATKAWTDQRRTGERYETLQGDAVRREARIEEYRAQGRLDDFAMRGFVAMRAALGE